MTKTDTLKHELNSMGPTHVKISHPNLINNYNLIKDKVGSSVKLMTIIKANAYGHGLIEVAQTLEKEKVDYLGVAFPAEGVQLRKAGIKTPVLIMGAHLNDDIGQQVDHNLDLTITRINQLEYLNTYCTDNNKTAGIHIKVDTGMNRVGLNEQDLFTAYDRASAYKNITVRGIYSHLSSSDEDDQSYTQKQLQRFRRIYNVIKQKDTSILFHLANSAGIQQNSDYWLDMVRAGIMLYGNPSNADFKIDTAFKEVMSFYTRIMLIKEVNKNEPVSYSRRYYTKEKTKIAVLPVGYADGYNRALTNNSFVLIQGKRYPVVGTVCMNHILVDIGIHSDFKVGEEVVLFGKQDNEHISIREMAKRLNTIPYEVTCWISSQVQRVHQY